MPKHPGKKSAVKKTLVKLKLDKPKKVARAGGSSKKGRPTKKKTKKA